jgi:hypothetical protein
MLAHRSRWPHSFSLLNGLPTIDNIYVILGNLHFHHLSIRCAPESYECLKSFFQLFFIPDVLRENSWLFIEEYLQDFVKAVVYGPR